MYFITAFTCYNTVIVVLGVTMRIFSHDEVVVGFKAKSRPDCPAVYTERTFITARGLI